MSALFPSLAVSRVASSSSPRSFQRPLALRVALLAGLVAVMVAAAALANASAYSAVEPELARLLRGMAVIKAGIALVAVALSLWRFGQPVSSPAAVGYLVGVWSLAGAAVFIWYLSFIAGAAIIFHLGLFGLLALVWREGRFAPRQREV